MPKSTLTAPTESSDGYLCNNLRSLSRYRMRMTTDAILAFEKLRVLLGAVVFSKIAVDVPLTAFNRTSSCKCRINLIIRDKSRMLRYLRKQACILSALQIHFRRLFPKLIRLMVVESKQAPVLGIRTVEHGILSTQFRQEFFLCHALRKCRLRVRITGRKILKAGQILLFSLLHSSHGRDTT